MLGEFCIWQAVEATSHPMQLACLVKAQQQLSRPALRTHVRRTENATMLGELKDEVGLVHD